MHVLSFYKATKSARLRNIKSAAKGNKNRQAQDYRISGFLNIQVCFIIFTPFYFTCIFLYCIIPLLLMNIVYFNTMFYCLFKIISVHVYIWLHSIISTNSFKHNTVIPNIIHRQWTVTRFYKFYMFLHLWVHQSKYLQHTGYSIQGTVYLCFFTMQLKLNLHPNTFSLKGNLFV